MTGAFLLEIAADSLASARIAQAGGADRIDFHYGDTETEIMLRDIEHCVQQAARWLTIMPGAGIHSGNIAALATATGAREFHASTKATRTSSMQFQNPDLVGLSSSWQQTDLSSVRVLRHALDTLSDTASSHHISNVRSSLL